LRDWVGLFVGGRSNPHSTVSGPKPDYLVERTFSVSSTCSKFLIAFVIVLFGFGAPRAEATTLTEAERKTISEFEAVSGQSFVEFAADVFHQKEVCEGAVGCLVPLYKVKRNVFLRLAGEKLFDERANLTNALRYLNETIDAISRATGLRIYFENYEKGDAAISLVFVDEDFYRGLPQGYINAFISPPSIGRNELRDNLFEHFMSNEELPCMGVLSEYEDIPNEVIFSDVWIKAHLPEDLIQKCISEEIYNSFGPDEGTAVPSVYDWPGVDASKGGKLGDLHLLLLRLLYLPTLEPGQSREETVFELREILNQ